ncbi:MAG: Asp-tRNA(Asn)/Glu-tRNA(Gln) amidotransferase subunit GatC [Elusimicrobia bacterium]|nr:Asp-tRNA(Asn)/Glu-tRNA(Gln) amidotransferase subunit GatC [Elusimicrobiota bacterium]
MAISLKEVAHVARLARLALTPEEQTLYAEQLGKILEHVSQLKELDTTHVTPTSHVLPLSNVWREDVRRVWGDAEPLLANAPEREGPFFKVKKVIEGEPGVTAPPKK